MFRFKIVAVLLISFLSAYSNDIYLNDEIYGYDSEIIHFEISKNIANLTGEVLLDNKPVSKIIFFEKNGKTIGKLENKLEASNSEYIININGKNKSKLIVFPTIAEAENEKIKNNFTALAYYSNNLFFQYERPSFLHIPLKNILIKTKFDGKVHKEIIGTTVSRSDEIIFLNKFNKASLEILYINPISKKEIALFPELTVDIKQLMPSYETAYVEKRHFYENGLINVRLDKIFFSLPKDIDENGNLLNYENVNLSIEIEKILVELDNYWYSDLKLVNEPKLFDGNNFSKSLLAQFDSESINSNEDLEALTENFRFTIYFSVKNKINGKLSDRQKIFIKYSVGDKKRLIIDEAINQLGKFDEVGSNIEIIEILDLDLISEIKTSLNLNRNEAIKKSEKIKNNFNYTDGMIQSIDMMIESNYPKSEILSMLIIEGYGVPSTENFDSYYQTRSKMKNKVTGTYLFVVKDNQNIEKSLLVFIDGFEKYGVDEWRKKIENNNFYRLDDHKQINENLQSKILTYLEQK